MTHRFWRNVIYSTHTMNCGTILLGRKDLYLKPIVSLILFSKNDTENFEHWYGQCFEPMSPPPISLEELLPSLLVYRWHYVLSWWWLEIKINQRLIITDYEIIEAKNNRFLITLNTLIILEIQLHLIQYDLTFIPQTL